MKEKHGREKHLVFSHESSLEGRGNKKRDIWERDEKSEGHPCKRRGTQRGNLSCQRF